MPQDETITHLVDANDPDDQPVDDPDSDADQSRLTGDNDTVTRDVNEKTKFNSDHYNYNRRRRARKTRKRTNYVDIQEGSDKDEETEKIDIEADPDFNLKLFEDTRCTSTNVDFDYKVKVVKFWKEHAGKPGKRGKIQVNRPFSSVQSRFRCCTNLNTLYSWARQVEKSERCITEAPISQDGQQNL